MTRLNIHKNSLHVFPEITMNQMCSLNCTGAPRHWIVSSASNVGTEVWDFLPDASQVTSENFPSAVAFEALQFSETSSKNAVAEKSRSYFCIYASAEGLCDLYEFGVVAQLAWGKMSEPP